jgi:hypothetical protein
MTPFRFLPLAFAVTAASALVACNTAPARPMGAAPASCLAAPDSMARMDAQMKTMRDMHEKMMNAKTPQERSKLMAERKKTMQDGMDMMGGMSMPCMGDMKDMKEMKDMPGMTGDMGARQQMMEKRMEMMQTMMKMMMDQMPAEPAK